MASVSARRCPSSIFLTLFTPKVEFEEHNQPGTESLRPARRMRPHGSVRKMQVRREGCVEAGTRGSLHISLPIRAIKKRTAQRSGSTTDRRRRRRPCLHAKDFGSTVGRARRSGRMVGTRRYGWFPGLMMSDDECKAGWRAETRHECSPARYIRGHGTWAMQCNAGSYMTVPWLATCPTNSMLADQ